MYIFRLELGTEEVKVVGVVILWVTGFPRKVTASIVVAEAAAASMAARRRKSSEILDWVMYEV